MKICLINPPQILNQRLGIPAVFQPLGLLYVAAVLEKEYSVEIIDATLEGSENLKIIEGQYFLGLTFDEIGERIKVLRPNVVGISVQFSVNEISALKVASKIKTVDKNIITILGGAHPTVRPFEILASDSVDFVVIGEGEVTIMELIRTLNERSYEKLNHISGIGYKNKDNIILTPPRDLIQNLDSLPFPARHLLPMEKYFKAMKTGLVSRQGYTYNDRWATLITSRGCPYNCNFCSIHSVMGKKFRPRSPENIINEIKQVVQMYNIGHINFEDDNLTLDKRRAGRLFDLMTQESLGITWSTPNGIRADTIEEDLIMKMKQSGCKRVFIAPESGVQRVVTEIIGKNLDLKKIEESVKLFKKHQITVDGSFVIGSIGETKKDIWNTIKYVLRLKKLGIEAVGLHIATPYYGTRLYEEAQRKGFLRGDINTSLFTTAEPLIRTPEWSIDEIRRFQKIAFFLLRINYFFEKKKAYIFSGLLRMVLFNTTFASLLFRFLRYIIKNLLVVFRTLGGSMKLRIVKALNDFI